MRYILYGAGGIGSGIGAQLANAGHEVVLIARGDHLSTIRADGLLVRTPEGEQRLNPTVVGHPDELEYRGDEVFLLTMKSQDTEQALDDLRRSAGSRVPVVLAQNGVANERMAARRFDRVYGMLVLMPALFLEPGVVVLHGTPKRGTLHCGAFPGGTDEFTEVLCRDLQTAGFEAEPHPNVMSLKYGKLLLNLGNGVQALCGPDADATALNKELRREAMSCFNAAGIDFVSARDLMKENRRTYGLGEVPGYQRGGGSAWQGLMRGTGTIETDFLNGEICLLGVLHGIPTPLNRAVQSLSADAAQNGRPPGSTSTEDIYALAGVEVPTDDPQDDA